MYWKRGNALFERHGFLAERVDSVERMHCDIAIGLFANRESDRQFEQCCEISFGTISAKRFGGGDAKQLASKISELEVALAAMTVAELAHGIYRANTPERRERRRMFLDGLKAAVPIYPLTESTA